MYYWCSSTTRALLGVFQTSRKPLGQVGIVPLQVWCTEIDEDTPFTPAEDLAHSPCPEKAGQEDKQSMKSLEKA